MIKKRIIITLSRGVAQLGSALAWGARGRRFKSFRPDQLNPVLSVLKSKFEIILVPILVPVWLSIKAIVYPLIFL